MPPQSSHRVRRRHRSPREWAGRIALACGIALLGYQSVAFSVAQVTAKARPQAADARVSYDGRLIAAHAAALITPTVTAAERAQAGTLSRAALRRDPTAVAAAATLGVVLLGQNDTATARQLLAYAQMLSRRNVQTQLWSIEDAVAQGDVSSALRWYDIALRTKPELSDMLYPVLAQASHDPAIRKALAHTLASKPAWSDSYIGYAAGQKDDPQSTAALFVDLRARGVTIPAFAQASVVNIMLDAGNLDQAWRYYTAIHPGATRVRARDPRFGALLETPSAFDWSTPNDNSISSSIRRTRDGGALEFSAPASIGGPVLQQVQLLPAGTYRLSGHSDGIAQDVRALPYWTLTCRSDGRELGRVVVPNSAQAGGLFAGMLTVPANCPVQTLTLFAQASDAVGGTSGLIDRAVLAPAG
jgi:hypothetical protein